VEKNGMLTTEDGYYIKSELDLYKQTNGKPTAEDRNRMAKKVADLEEAKDGQDEKDEQDEPDEPDEKDEQDDTSDTDAPEEKPERTYCGYTIEELMQMPFNELWQIIINCEEF